MGEYNGKINITKDTMLFVVQIGIIIVHSIC